MDAARLDVGHDPEALARATGAIYAEGLELAPRFALTLQDYAADELVRTVVTGLLELASRTIEGFSVCPLLTESVRCTSLAADDAEVEVRFCAAVLTFFMVPEGPTAEAHDGHLGLYQTYYREILTRFATRRMEEILNEFSAARRSDLERQATEALSRGLVELRTRFPLDPFQSRWERMLRDGRDPQAALRRLRASMREEARRRLGI